MIRCFKIILFLVCVLSTNISNGQFNGNIREYFLLYYKYNTNDKDIPIALQDLKIFAQENQIDITLMATEQNAEYQFLIVKTKQINRIKSVLFSEFQISWNAYRLDLKFALTCMNSNGIFDCEPKKAHLVLFEPNYTKDTIRTLDESNLAHENFVNQLKNRDFIISAELDHGKEGFFYLSKESIPKELFNDHKGIHNSFLIPRVFLVKYCSTTFCR